MGSDEELDYSRWQVLYPNYINSKKSIPEGRRIGVAKAVENPQATEMAEICQFLEIPFVLEMDKAYPRDWMIRGRVRVLLKTPEGKFTHATIHTKGALMLQMGELIPKLKSRASGAVPPDPKQLALSGALNTAAAPASASSAAAGAASAAPMSRDARKEAKREEKKAQKKSK
mmetsp:Transcript_7907/g.17479  ORF Transcript_7907/g.17479 Transcript_7907/m.17479 type:complete len:172 (+) Transcript_7907:103-618(+)